MVPPNPVELAKAQAEVIAAKSKERIAELSVQEKELEVAAKRFDAASKAHADINRSNGVERKALAVLGAEVERLRGMVEGMARNGTPPRQN